MTTRRFLSKSAALALVLSLSLPQPAFALRVVTPQEAGTEEDLLAGLGVEEEGRATWAAAGTEEAERRDRILNTLNSRHESWARYQRQWNTSGRAWPAGTAELFDREVGFLGAVLQAIRAETPLGQRIFQFLDRIAVAHRRAIPMTGAGQIYEEVWQHLLARRPDWRGEAQRPQGYLNRLEAILNDTEAREELERQLVRPCANTEPDRYVAENELLAERLSTVPPVERVILDRGVSTGETSLKLRQRLGGTVIAIDRQPPSEAFVQLTPLMLLRGYPEHPRLLQSTQEVQFRQANITEQIPGVDGKVVLLRDAGILEHLDPETRRRAVEGAFRLAGTRAGGIWYHTTSGSASWPTMLSQYIFRLTGSGPRDWELSHAGYLLQLGGKDRSALLSDEEVLEHERAISSQVLAIRIASLARAASLPNAPADLLDDRGRVLPEVRTALAEAVIPPGSPNRELLTWMLEDILLISPWTPLDEYHGNVYRERGVLGRQDLAWEFTENRLDLEGLLGRLRSLLGTSLGGSSVIPGEGFELVVPGEGLHSGRGQLARPVGVLSTQFLSGVQVRLDDLRRPDGADWDEHRGPWVDRKKFSAGRKPGQGFHASSPLRANFIKRIDRRILPAVPTPTDRNGVILEEQLRAYARAMSKKDIAGVAISVHTGRGPHRTLEEWVRVYRIWREELGPDKLIVVGVNSVGMARLARQVKADAMLVFPPRRYIGAPDRARQVARYHQKIAEAGVPMVLFDLTQEAGGMGYTKEELLQLGRIPQVVAIKSALWVDIVANQDKSQLMAGNFLDIVQITGEDRFWPESVRTVFRNDTDSGLRVPVASLLGMSAAFPELEAEFLWLFDPWEKKAKLVKRENKLGYFIDAKGRVTFFYWNFMDGEHYTMETYIQAVSYLIAREMGMSEEQAREYSYDIGADEKWYKPHYNPAAGRTVPARFRAGPKQVLPLRPDHFQQLENYYQAVRYFQEKGKLPKFPLIGLPPAQAGTEELPSIFRPLSLPEFFRLTRRPGMPLAEYYATYYRHWHARTVIKEGAPNLYTVLWREPSRDLRSNQGRPIRHQPFLEDVIYEVALALGVNMAEFYLPNPAERAALVKAYSAQEWIGPEDISLRRLVPSYTPEEAKQFEQDPRKAFTRGLLVLGILARIWDLHDGNIDIIPGTNAWLFFDFEEALNPLYNDMEIYVRAFLRNFFQPDFPETPVFRHLSERIDWAVWGRTLEAIERLDLAALREQVKRRISRSSYEGRELPKKVSDQIDGYFKRLIARQESIRTDAHDFLGETSLQLQPPPPAKPDPRTLGEALSTGYWTKQPDSPADEVEERTSLELAYPGKKDAVTAAALVEASIKKNVEKGKWIVILDSSVAGSLGAPFEFFMEQVPDGSLTAARVYVVGTPKAQFYVPPSSQVETEEELFRALARDMASIVVDGSGSGIKKYLSTENVTVTFLGPEQRGERIGRFVRGEGFTFRMEPSSLLAFLLGLNVPQRLAEELAADLEDAALVATGA